MDAQHSAFAAEKNNCIHDAENSRLDEKYEYYRHGNPVLLQLQEFFQDTMEADHSSIDDLERRIWNLILSYIQWLQRLDSSSPLGPEDLKLAFEEWKTLYHHKFGSSPRGYLWEPGSGWWYKFTSRQVGTGRVLERLRGRKAKQICFCLLSAVEEAVSYDEWPPKFKYNKDLVMLPPKELAFLESEETKAAEYRAQHEKMTTIFTIIKHHPDFSSQYSGNLLLDACLKYLGWMAAQYDIDKLQMIYTAFDYSAIVWYHQVYADHAAYRDVQISMRKHLSFTGVCGSRNMHRFGNGCSIS